MIANINMDEEDQLFALEQRLNDFFDNEDVYVMSVSDAS